MHALARRSALRALSSGSLRDARLLAGPLRRWTGGERAQTCSRSGRAGPPAPRWSEQARSAPLRGWRTYASTPGASADPPASAWRCEEYPKGAADPAFEEDLARVDAAGKSLEERSEALTNRLEALYAAQGGVVRSEPFAPLLEELAGLLKDYFAAFGVCADLAGLAQMLGEEAAEERAAAALDAFTERATTVRALAGDLQLDDEAFAALAERLAGPAEDPQEAAHELRFFFGRARRQALHALAHEEVAPRLPPDVARAVDAMRALASGAQLGYFPAEAPPPDHFVVYAWFLSEVERVARGFGAPDAGRAAAEEAGVDPATAEGFARAEAECAEAARGVLRAAGAAFYTTPLGPRDFALSHRPPDRVQIPPAREEGAEGALRALGRALGPHYGRDVPALLAGGRVRIADEVAAPAVHVMTRGGAPRVYLALPPGAAGPLALPTLARAAGLAYLEARRAEAGVAAARYGGKGAAAAELAATFFELRAVEAALAGAGGGDRTALALVAAQRAAELGLLRPALAAAQRAMLRLEGVEAFAAEGALPRLMADSLREWYGDGLLEELPTSVGAVWLAALAEPSAGGGFPERFGRLAACGLLEAERAAGPAFGPRLDALLARLGARPLEAAAADALGLDLRGGAFWEGAARGLRAHAAAVEAALRQCAAAAPARP